MNDKTTIGIDEQIEYGARYFTGNIYSNAILATLGHYKRIMSAEMPEPVAYAEVDSDGKAIDTCLPDEIDQSEAEFGGVYKSLYGHALLDYALRMKAERDAEKDIVSRIWKILGNPSYKDLAGRSIYDLVQLALDRAETAERQLAECQKECEEQARLNGMGSEREARLMAQLAELREKHERLVVRLREPTLKMLEEVGPMSNYDMHAAGASPDADHVSWFVAMSTVALRDSEGGE